MRILIAACLMSGIALQAEQEAMIPVNTLFSHAEWQEIFSKRRCPEDFVILIDGTKLYGELDKVPSLKYTFGTYDFEVRDIAAISVVPQGPHYKLQYVTREGQNFIGTVGQGKFGMWVLEPTYDDPLNTVRKEIDPKSVSFILLRERDRPMISQFYNVSSITLRNGDHLPALLPKDPLPITDGWNDTTLASESIVEIYFNGGIHGQVIENGNTVPLNFCFVKDRCLTVQVPYQGHQLRLPWDQIDHIQAHNGGFKKEQDGKVSRQLMPLDELDEVVQSGLQSTAPDAIGPSRGTLLSDASAAVALPPKAFEGLALLGSETLQPEPRFNEAEEKEWLIEVAFDDEMVMAVENAQPEIVASVDPEDLQAVSEAALFEHLESIDSDPETFDVPPLPKEDAAPIANVEEVAKEEPKEEAKEEAKEELKEEAKEENESEVELTPEALSIIEEILSEDELDDFDFPLIGEPEDHAPVLTEEAIAIIQDILADDDLDDITTLMPTKIESENEEEDHGPGLTEEAMAIIQDILAEDDLGDLSELEEFTALVPLSIDSATEPEPVPLPIPVPEPEPTPEIEDEPKPLDLFWGVSETSDSDELSDDEVALLDELFGGMSQNILEVAMAYIKGEKLGKIPSMRDLGLYKATLVPTAQTPTLVFQMPPFYIDRHPVTNREYEDFVNATGHRAPVHWKEGKVPPGQQDKPVVNVSYQDAQQYAEWAGKRLPTESDWIRAMSAGAIQSQQNGVKEWTATADKPRYKVAISDQSTELLHENYFDHRLSFRTAANATQ